LQAWTEAESIPSALVSMLLRLPKIKFAIVTLGEDGCIMLERSVEGIYVIARFLLRKKTV
jgi:sugar/nucleoside kinase (ribokinase family)